MFKGWSYVDYSQVFLMSTCTNMRVLPFLLKLVKYDCHLDCRKYFFSFRLIKTWNALDEEIQEWSVTKLTDSKIESTSFCIVEGLYKPYKAFFPQNLTELNRVLTARRDGFCPVSCI